MSTYPLGGDIPQYAKYIGEFVPTDQTVQYFYQVMAYDINSLPLSTANNTPFAYGTQVLDGDHAISINWSPFIGAFYFMVFKGIGAAPDSSTDEPWYMASASETSILDVGYPCATRNSFLNPDLSPIFAAGCCGDDTSEATNVPPVGMAQPDDGHQGGGFVRVQNLGAMLAGSKVKPAGNPGEVQFNSGGQFGASAYLFWDDVNQRLGIRTNTPQYPLDVNS